MTARRLIVLALPLVFYAAPDGLTDRPADLCHIPFLLKPDQASLILKRLSTALNEASSGNGSPWAEYAASPRYAAQLSQG